MSKKYSFKFRHNFNLKLKKRIIIIPILVIIIIFLAVFIFIENATYASPLNESLYKYELSQYNETLAMNDAILSRGGSALDTCVLFQANCLRAIGVDIPSSVTFTTELASYLENNGWVKETNLNNLQKGDICFAGNIHTFLFMGWKNYSEHIAYVMGDESYMFPSSYNVRNLNGQVGNSSNGDNTQYKTSYYLKYVGSYKGTATAASYKTPTAIKNALGRVSINSSSGTYMTSEPSDSSNIVSILDDNIVLYVLKSENGWYEVDYDGETGYVQSKYTTGLGNPIANTSENIEDVDATT